MRTPPSAAHANQIASPGESLRHGPGAGLLILDKFAFTIHAPGRPEYLALADEYHLRKGRRASGDRVAAWLRTPEGCRFWVWLLARRSHPHIKPADLKQLITTDNVDDVLSVLADIEKASTAVAPPAK